MRLEQLLKKCLKRIPSKQHCSAIELITVAHRAGYFCIGFDDRDSDTIKSIDDLVGLDGSSWTPISLSSKFVISVEQENFVKLISEALLLRDGQWFLMLVYADWLEERMHAECQGWRFLAKNKRKAKLQNYAYTTRDVDKADNTQWTFNYGPLEKSKGNLPFLVGNYPTEFAVYQAAARKYVEWLKSPTTVQ